MNPLQRLAARWAALHAERQIRWTDGSHHCVVCGAAFGADSECRCD